jgi:transcriptional regulator with XRE-family HTH domain
MKAMLANAGMSQSELADRMGVTRQAVSKWVNLGVLPTDKDRIVKLAEVLGVTPEQLLFGDGVNSSTVITQEDGEDYVLIPHLDVKGSCGRGDENPHRPLVKLMKVAKEWLRIHAPFASINHLHIILADGDSMEPTIKNGDLLLVDTSQREIRSDAVFVFRYQDEVFVKRMQRISHGLRILSDNPAYPPFEILGEDTEGLSVIGRVYTVGLFKNI